LRVATVFGMTVTCIQKRDSDPLPAGFNDSCRLKFSPAE